MATYATFLQEIFGALAVDVCWLKQTSLNSPIVVNNHCFLKSLWKHKGGQVMYFYIIFVFLRLLYISVFVHLWSQLICRSMFFSEQYSIHSILYRWPLPHTQKNLHRLLLDSYVFVFPSTSSDSTVTLWCDRTTGKVSWMVGSWMMYTP